MKTEIIVITDRSGSMSSIKSDADGGFNTFIEDQKKVEGECRVTHIWFDTTIETLYQAKPLAEVPKMDLQPRGSTAMLDAIGSTLNVQGKRIADEKWADLVIVVITTDGQENASREYKREQVKSMVEHAEKSGWRIIYLAANQDAVTTGAGMGIGNFSDIQNKSFSFNAAGTRSAYASASVDTVQLRSGLAPKNAPTL